MLLILVLIRSARRPIVYTVRLEHRAGYPEPALQIQRRNSVRASTAPARESD
jgi:hypothetical protein